MKTFTAACILLMLVVGLGYGQVKTKKPPPKPFNVVKACTNSVSYVNVRETSLFGLYYVEGAVQIKCNSGNSYQCPVVDLYITAVDSLCNEYEATTDIGPIACGNVQNRDLDVNVPPMNTYYYHFYGVERGSQSHLFDSSGFITIQ